MLEKILDCIGTDLRGLLTLRSLSPGMNGFVNNHFIYQPTIRMNFRTNSTHTAYHQHVRFEFEFRIVGPKATLLPLLPLLHKPNVTYKYPTISCNFLTTQFNKRHEILNPLISQCKIDTLSITESDGHLHDIAEMVDGKEIRILSYEYCNGRGRESGIIELLNSVKSIGHVHLNSFHVNYRSVPILNALIKKANSIKIDTVTGDISPLVVDLVTKGKCRKIDIIGTRFSRLETRTLYEELSRLSEHIVVDIMTNFDAPVAASPGSDILLINPNQNPFINSSRRMAHNSQLDFKFPAVK